MRRSADVQALSIDPDPQADPAHKGLLILTATIRNRTHYAIGTAPRAHADRQPDRVSRRRALAPVEYASGTADLAQASAQRGGSGEALHRRERHHPGGLPAPHLLP